METKQCPYCGGEIQKDATRCQYCKNDLTMPPPNPGAGQYSQQYNYQQPDGGYEQTPRYNGWENNDPFAEGPNGKSRGVTAILAILLGGLGIHYFYLGKPVGGIVYLIASLVTCGSIPAVLGIIQGAMMFGMTNADFERRYVTTPSSFPF
ncbi:MAG: TM2 domain-containing protein [Paramuribaculum sp.]|nr:TM2 domain-containing protein [Paramuribaculum sp.]